MSIPWACAGTSERGILLEYIVRIPQEEPDHFHIRVRVSSFPGGFLQLAMTQNYGKVKKLMEIIPEVSVSGVGQTPPAVNKINEFLWRIEPAGGDFVVIDYAVNTKFPYSSLNSVRLPYRDADHLYFPAASAFIHPEERYLAENKIKIQRIRVDFILPEGWTANTSWGINQPTYDLSPPSLENLNSGLVAVGGYRTYSFSVRDLPVEVALLKSGPIPDEEINQAIEQGLLAGHNLFSFFPVPRLFALLQFIFDHPGQGSGNGLGWSINLNSSRTSDSPEWLNGKAHIFHEIFHLWNGTEDSPISRAQSDHSLIWFTEGVTRFYQYKNMLRSGIISEDAYYRYLSGELSDVCRDPRRDDSLKDISEDYYSDQHAMALTYSKGCCLAFALDLLLQRESYGKKNFDNVMKRMLEKYDFRLSEHCYTHDELVGVFSEVLGERSYRAFEMLYGRDFVQAFESILNAAGLRLERSKGRRLYFGIIDFGPPSGPLKAYKIDRDSPAYQTGLREQDVLLEINNHKVNDIPDIEKALHGAREGDFVVLLIERNGRKMKIRTPWASYETRLEIKTSAIQRLK